MHFFFNVANSLDKAKGCGRFRSDNERALKQFTQLVKSFINVFRVTHILNQYLNQGLIFAIGSIETRKSFLFQENLL